MVKKETNQGTKTKEAAFQVPPLMKIKLINLEGLTPEKAAEEAERLKKETLPRLQEQTRLALSSLEAISGKLQAFLKLDRDGQDIAKKDITKLEKAREEQLSWLDEYLGHEFGPYRRTTWETVLAFHFSKDYKDKGEFDLLLDSLCQKKDLEEGENGPLVIFGKHYKITEKADFGKQETDRVQKIVSQLEYKFRQKEKLEFQSRVNALLDEGKLSTEAFLRGTKGLYAIMPHDDDGSTGVLVAESRGESVLVFKALGSFQAEMEELKKTGKFLLRHVLSWETIVPNFFSRNPQFSPREAELLMKFWQLLKSGVERKKKREGVQWLKKKIAARSNTSEEDFLLNSKDGTYFFEQEGKPWLVDDSKSFHDFFFLVERRTNGEGPAISLIDCPHWLDQYFEGMKGKWYPEGKQFSGLPRPLQDPLRAGWGRAKKHSQIIDQ